MDDKFTTHVRKRERVAPPQKPRAFKTPDAGFKRKLINSTVACAIIALGVWGMSVVDTNFTQNVTEELAKAVNSEMIIDQDLGKLRLVDPATNDVSASALEIPLTGEVVSVFAVTGKDVVIKSNENETVRAVFSGLVVKTMSTGVVVQNDNGTQTTYDGVMPGVKAGVAVMSGSVLGQLEGDTLTLNTVGGTGYVDSLAEIPS